MTVHGRVGIRSLSNRDGLSASCWHLVDTRWPGGRGAGFMAMVMGVAMLFERELDQ